MDRIPAIAVVGPTASGKTALAVGLALHFGGDVISADSMQIYKGMNVATAKPTAEEMMGVTHRMMDFLDPTEKYSVAAYVADANAAVDETLALGRLPIICGGTGLYVDCLLKNMTFSPENETDEIRRGLLRERDEKGMEALYAELKSIDPEYAAHVHVNNAVRVIRALEIYRQTGLKPSDARARAFDTESRFDPLYIGLDFIDRENLYDRINRRVDMMLEAGLVEEALAFRSAVGATAAQAIGYKELEPYFEGTRSLEECVDSLRRATRRYAKRHLTWFRKNKEIHWLYPDGERDVAAAAADLVRSFLNERRQGDEGQTLQKDRTADI